MQDQQNTYSPEEMAVISEAVKQSGKAADEKMKNFSWLMGAVILALFIGFITLLAAVATMIIDSFHFNSATYQEYSSKTEIQNKLLEDNKKLMEVVLEDKKTIERIDKQINNASRSSEKQ